MNEGVNIHGAGTITTWSTLLGAPVGKFLFLISRHYLHYLPKIPNLVHLAMARSHMNLCVLFIFQAYVQYVAARPYGLDWVVDGIKSSSLGSSLFYKRDGSGAVAVNGNATLQQSIWILEDTYEGKTFFEYASISTPVTTLF